MRFWSILALASQAFSSPIQLRATNEVDALSSTALQNKIAYDTQSGMNKNCTAKNAVVRREWSDLQPSERKKYTDAVVCLMNKPAKLTAPDAPGIRTRYDDFVSVHIRQTPTIHGTGNFLTWHRLYIWTFEQALRKECGYTGYLPYWAWEKYVDNLLESALFDGSEYSMSGNGRYAPNNGTAIVFDNSSSTHLPGGQGGGCVTSGPFKNMVVNLGPVSPAYVSGGIEPQKDKSGLGYNPRCLRRDVTQSTIRGANTVENVTTLIQNNDYIGMFQDVMQGLTPARTLGVHGGGHFTIGGDPASDVFVSPGDPMFFLHHGMIDRVFWIWQNLEPESRRHVVAGTVTLGNDPPSRDASLEDLVDMGGLGENKKLDDLLDTTLGELCYVYT